MAAPGREASGELRFGGKKSDHLAEQLGMLVEFHGQFGGHSVGAEDHDTVHLPVPVTPQDHPQGQPAYAQKASQQKQRKYAQCQPPYVSSRDVIHGQQNHHQKHDRQQEMRNHRRQTPPAAEAIEVKVFLKQNPGEHGANRIDNEIERRQSNLVSSENPS